MMEAMMSMRNMMEVNAATSVTASTTTKRDSTHLPSFNQVSHLISDVVGQGDEAVENAYGLHYVQVQSKSCFPPYGLPPNYTLPTVVYAPSENISNSAPIFIKSQQPQLNHTFAHVYQSMGETHDAPQDHTLTDFRVYPGYTTEGHALSSVPVPNALRVPQYQPPSQPLCFAMEEGPPVVVKNEKFNHTAERLRVIEGGGNYGFADMSELCLVPDVVIPLKFKVPDFDKYKGTSCPKNHLKMYCRKM